MNFSHIALCTAFCAALCLHDLLLYSGQCRAAVLTPSGMLSVCPGDEVVIKCNKSDNIRIALGWTISLRNRTIPSIDLSPSDITINTERQEVGLLQN